MTSTLAVQLQALTALKAVGAPLNNASLILYKNNATLNKDTVLADLQEATFNGYARIEGLVFSAPFVPVTGVPQVVAPSETFVSTDGIVEEIVYGFAITNNGYTSLWYAEALEQPVPITAAAIGVTVSPVVKYGE